MIDTFVQFSTGVPLIGTSVRLLGDVSSVREGSTVLFTIAVGTSTSSCSVEFNFNITFITYGTAGMMSYLLPMHSFTPGLKFIFMNDRDS